jgi:hypothetical protein
MYWNMANIYSYNLYTLYLEYKYTAPRWVVVSKYLNEQSVEKQSEQIIQRMNVRPMHEVGRN